MQQTQMKMRTPSPAPSPYEEGERNSRNSSLSHCHMTDSQNKSIRSRQHFNRVNSTQRNLSFETGIRKRKIIRSEPRGTPLCILCLAAIVTITVIFLSWHPKERRPLGLLKEPYIRRMMPKLVEETNELQRQVNEEVEQALEDALQNPTLTDEWWLETPVIHVIQTRFNQFQPNLVELGNARLSAFKSFCLASMRRQTSQHFLWIIRTDPELNTTLREELVRLVAPHPNFLLIGSNSNPEGFRDPASVLDVLNVTNVISGDVELAGKVHAAAQTRIVVESRLDADDGLHSMFTEFIQREAFHYLDPGLSSSTTEASTGAKKKAPQWLVFCAHSHLEWHYSSPFSDNITVEDDSFGYLVGLTLPYCITPGLSFGYGIGAVRSDLPRANHDKLNRLIPPCEGKKSHHPNFQNCLLRLKHLAPTAIRARTPTSHGMDHVIRKKGTGLYDGVDRLFSNQEEMWHGINVVMGIERQRVARTKTFLSEHLVGIVEDNLHGQCTKGHSCKGLSQELLHKLLETSGTPEESAKSHN